MSARPALPPDGTIHVIMNAGSGADDKSSARSVLERGLSARGNPVRFHLIENPEHIPDTIEEAVGACRRAPGIVVAAGGDGTVNAVAAALSGTDIPFAVVPMGTFNYFARDIGMPADIAESAKAIVDGEIAPGHVARLNDRVFLVNASIGLYVRLIEERERHESRLGRNRVVAVISSLLTALRGHYAMTLDLTIDGATRSVRTPLVFMGKNYLQLRNLDFDIAEGVAQGRIGVIVLRDARPRTIVALTLQAMFGKLDEAEWLTAFCADRLEIRTRRRVVSVVIDGEIMTLQTPLVVEVRRNALSVVRPRPADADPEENSLAAAGGER